jgi:uncharacterized membrane protein YhaH (DUF805 family)
MNNDYNPQLQALFEQARETVDCDAFTRRVLESVDRERRRAMLGWSVFGIALLLVLAMLAKPVFGALAMATQLLPVSLIDIESEWLRQLVSPINSVAALIALCALGIHRFFRRFLR